MKIRNAGPDDLPRILEIYEAARQSLRAMGVDQWQDGYPDAAAALADMQNGTGRVLEENGLLLATAAVYVGHEPTYDSIYNGKWQTKARTYSIIHRIAVAPEARNKGAASRLVAFCAEIAGAAGVSSMRCDTHPDNAVMRRTLEKNGYTLCGTIYLADGAVRVGYERIL